MRTAILFGLLTGLLLLVGELLKMPLQGIIIFVALMNFITYWFSDRIVLAMYRAKLVDQNEAPELHSIVAKVAIGAGIPKPKVAVIQSATPNAFATGRGPGNAVVAVTTGITNLLDRDELEGVIGHEISHIKNRDILVSTVAAVMAGVIITVARWAGYFAMFGGMRDEDRGGNRGAALLMMILAPIAAMLIQMAISRAREYLADESSAKITKKPWALANALRKLEGDIARHPMDANPATAHMFIVNPLRAESLINLFSTHPPIPERVARLEKMSVY